MKLTKAKKETNKLGKIMKRMKRENIKKLVMEDKGMVITIKKLK